MKDEQEKLLLVELEPVHQLLLEFQSDYYKKINI